MNKQRRKELQQVMDDLEAIKERLELLKDEEDDYHENMPDNLKDCARGTAAESAVSSLDDAFTDLESAIDNIISAIE